MKALTHAQLHDFLNSLKEEYDVRVPILLQDGTRTLGRLDEGEMQIHGGKISIKPTNVFFPQHEVFLRVTEGDDIQMAQAPEKPLLVLGMVAADLDCLEFIDQFFAEKYRDDIYFNKRDGAVLIGVSGKCGENGEFLKIAGTKCDAELISDGSKFIFAPYSENGKTLNERISSFDEAGDINELKKQSEELPADDEVMLNEASNLLQKGVVTDDFWTEIAERCIACTSCNLACPTCTCFDVYDRVYGGEVRRCRIWDSCQLDGFMREASGHNPMAKESVRTRRRIHHKLVADRTRWGHITCYLCGRCDDVCPTNIGIKSISRKIVNRFG
ncbi:4Fe-4S dicluster domain-containing protein [Candidatus Riflebacteria bacterium]